MEHLLPIKPKKPVAGRISLDELMPMQEKMYIIGNLKWVVGLDEHALHMYNGICIMLLYLEPKETVHVCFELVYEKCFPKKMTFWHVFDAERNRFRIPLPTAELYSHITPTLRKGTLEKGRESRSYLRIAMNPKIWRYRNWQFPFADLILKVGNKELYVNRKILSNASRFFQYIMSTSRVKRINTHEVLHVKDVSFEDLYDLVGHIYHGWHFYYEREVEVAKVAEKFGVCLSLFYLSYDFEGRVYMDVTAGEMTENPDAKSFADCHMIREQLEERSSEHIEDGLLYLWNTANKSPQRSKKCCPSSEHHDPQIDRPTFLVLSSESVSRPSPREENDVDFPMEVDFDPVFEEWADENDGSDDSSESYSDAEEEHEAQNEREREPGTSNDNHDDREEYRYKFLKSKKIFVGCQDFEFTSSRMSTKLNLTIEPLRKNPFSRGHDFMIRTCFGDWELYLYSKMVNSERYLALGIYGNILPERFINHMYFEFEFERVNEKPLKKTVEKWISSETNTLGWPNFLPWVEVEKMLNDEGDLEFELKLSASLICYQKIPKLEYKMFPGKKDVFVKIEQHIFPVSKDVLSNASPVLKEMFDEPVLLSRSNIFEIKDICYTDFMILLDYIYNKKSSILDNHGYYRLMRQAQRFKMQEVVDQLVREFVEDEDLSDDEAKLFSYELGLDDFMYKYYGRDWEWMTFSTNTFIRDPSSP